MTERDDALIRPAVFRPFYRRVSRRAFLVFQQRHVDRIASQGGYDASKAREIGPFRYLPGRNRDDFGLAGPVVGAPAAALAAEFLIALGCREIVCFGICGSIHGRLRIGHAVVPDGAVPEDGTSVLYLPGRARMDADAALSATVRAAAERSGLSPETATVWTTDAFFRETPEKVERFRGLGCRAVEMELAALCAVAEFRRAKLAALMVVSDELFGKRWKPGFLHPSFRRSVRKGIDALLSLRNTEHEPGL